MRGFKDNKVHLINIEIAETGVLSVREDMS